MDQTAWLLGFSLLSREGIALATHSRADRIVGNKLVLTTVRQRRFLQFRILNPRLR